MAGSGATGMKARDTENRTAPIRSISTAVLGLMAILPTAACAALPEAGSVTAAREPRATSLAAHRAVYDMSLEGVEPGVGIVNVKGRMAVSFSHTCESWTLNQLSRLTITYDEGKPATSDLTFESRERFDGLGFRFQYGDYRDARPFEIAKGAVARDALAEPARVGFRLPPGRRESLPAGTLFPTEHTLHLLEVAQRGETWARDKVFTGSGLDSLALVTAFIGGPVKKPSEAWPAGADVSLRQDRVWPMRLSFFPLADEDSVPDYEIDYQIQLNGVVRGFILDYGDFAIRSSLSVIEPIATPACR